MAKWVIRGVALPTHPPAVMGILNVTPDSFSDGGSLVDLASVIERALRFEAEGAAILDIGGESTRPGARPVPTEEELRRVVPVVEALSEVSGLLLSVDTSKAEVARYALAAGASIINDVTALGDPEMAAVVAEGGASIVLMHMAGTPQTMQLAPHYDDVVEEVYSFLDKRLRRAQNAGLSREQIALDPGIGFGKTYGHNLELLRRLEIFANLDCPVVLGVSRKGFLGTITARPAGERTAASIAAALYGMNKGAAVLRVHDVGPTVDAIRVWNAIESGSSHEDAG